jgi:hypothetical protein
LHLSDFHDVMSFCNDLYSAWMKNILKMVVSLWVDHCH